MVLAVTGTVNAVDRVAADTVAAVGIVAAVRVVAAVGKVAVVRAVAVGGKVAVVGAPTVVDRVAVVGPPTVVGRVAVGDTAVVGARIDLPKHAAAKHDSLVLSLLAERALMVAFRESDHTQGQSKLHY